LPGGVGFADRRSVVGFRRLRAGASIREGSQLLAEELVATPARMPSGLRERAIDAVMSAISPVL
jgi:hypothetical protein